MSEQDRSSTGPGLERFRPGNLRTGVSRASAEVILIVTVLLWSGSYTAARYAVTNGFEPIAYSSVRFAIGAAIFVAVVLWREGSLRISRRHLPYLVPAALVGVVINQVSFHYSVSLTEAAVVALIFGTLPIFAAILTMLLGWEALSTRHWIATGVSFAGVALVALGVSGRLSADLGGVLLALVASATFATFSVYAGRLMQHYSVYRVTAVVVLAGTIPLLLVASPQIAGMDWGALEPLAWTAFGYVVFMFVATTYLWFIAIDRVGAPHATLWVNLQPFIGALFAVLILSEDLVAIQIAGGVVIAISIALARTRHQPITPRID